MRILLTLLALAASLSTAAAPAAAQHPAGGSGPTFQFDPDESLLVQTMIRTEEPPPARSLRIVQLLHNEAFGAPAGYARTKEQALQVARTVSELGRAGTSMRELARTYSAARNAVTGGVLGTFAEGILASAFDEFLFQAEVGQISDPIELPTGVFVLERVERWAAARTIMVRGLDDAARARMQTVIEQLEAGRPFGEVATELSEDEVTKVREGALAIFERGPEDRLLKAAAFEAEVGETVGPIESPFGLHLVQRVAISDLPETVRERNWARFSAIVLIQKDTALPIPVGDRGSVATAGLIDEIYRRYEEEGADFDQLARDFNEDFGGGKERAGDLGWMHARQPALSPSLRMAFGLKIGDVLEPQPTNFGWMLIRRTG